MEYRLMFDLEIIKSPVVIVFKENETRYTDGTVAKSSAKFSKPVVVAEIKARNDEIVVEVEENTQYNDTSWTDKEVSFF